MLCSDDYTEESNSIDGGYIEKNFPESIMWHDTPGQDSIPTYLIEPFIPAGDPKNPFTPVNPTPWDGETGKADLNFINKKYFKFISIIEDSNEQHRFVYFINDLAIINRNDKATSKQKFDIIEPSCYGIEQERKNGKWEIIIKNGKQQDNLPCGKEGLQ